MGKIVDIKGKKFNRLTVLEYVGNSKWLCKCACGKETIVLGADIRSGHTKSCGCYNSEQAKLRNSTHNKTKTRLYETWEHIKRRCYSITCNDYKNYGSRGIKVCDEWRNDFMAFYNWAIQNGYDDNLTIDRIDNNGNYEPSNCRWVDRYIQANNTRRNHYYIVNGEKLTISEIARKYNMNYNTLNNRLWHGMSIEDALNTPLRKWK